MRTCLARHILWLKSERKYSMQQSVDKSLEMMANRVDGFGGAIAVASDGQLGIGFSTEMMSWAYIDGQNPAIHYGIKRGQHLTDKF